MHIGILVACRFYYLEESSKGFVVLYIYIYIYIGILKVLKFM